MFAFRFIWGWYSVASSLLQRGILTSIPGGVGVRDGLKTVPIYFPHLIKNMFFVFQIALEFDFLADCLDKFDLWLLFFIYQNPILFRMWTHFLALEIFLNCFVTKWQSLICFQKLVWCQIISSPSSMLFPHANSFTIVIVVDQKKHIE